MEAPAPPPPSNMAHYDTDMPTQAHVAVGSTGPVTSFHHGSWRHRNTGSNSSSCCHGSTSPAASFHHGSWRHGKHRLQTPLSRHQRCCRRAGQRAGRCACCHGSTGPAASFHHSSWRHGNTGSNAPVQHQQCCRCAGRRAGRCAGPTARSSCFAYLSTAGPRRGPRRGRDAASATQPC